VPPNHDVVGHHGPVRHRAVLICIVAGALLVLAAYACGSDGSTPPTNSVTAGDRSGTDADTRDGSADDRRRSRVRVGSPDAPPERDPDRDAATQPETTPVTEPEGPQPEGAAILDVTLRDRATERPEESQVRLWRIAATTDERTGEPIDQEHSTFFVRGRTRVTGLVPGRYRLEVWAAAPGTDDPPAFDVHESAPTEFIADIVVPESVEMRLRVVDEFGAVVEHGSRRPGASGHSFASPSGAPHWARVPPPAPNTGGFSGGAGGRRTMYSGARDTAVAAEDGAFALGSVRRAGRHLEWLRSYRFTFAGRNQVAVTARSREADAGEYLAVAVPAGPLIKSVFLPDGRRAVEAGANIAVICWARATAPGSTAAWRTTPITVSATLDGYERLTFTWTIDSGAPQPHTMERTPEPESDPESD
jgi:hypothetical protein